ncbi:MAG: Two component transcriptional regulator, winged helix family [candidate division WS6 bacterium GW2011_GWE1_34_7]|uniref:Two component transcriptional regulator, winged helix family n=1 Tax=candidate division WS6 bacterium GW2011_GWE1_34_7 TaxID=1619093 RepID=A0A0G0DN22_9BACT|nr:MAG: Two component transcriptional regulator, winged helix family [candidate division WS6 bacterium GW2011_GWE1_34_7]
MNILIIEKSKTISHILKNTLVAYGYNITEDSADFGSENLVDRGLFEILIIDTNLNGKYTTENILKKLKEKKNIKTKILGICSIGIWKDKVNFLNSGGDDVLSYPFPVQELIARIQSLLRRPNSYVDSRMYIGDILLDTTNKTVSVKNSDIDLRKKEYQLLEYLVRNRNRTVSRCELLDHVWDYRSYTGSNTIDVHVKRLRDKIPCKGLIETVHGQGYRVKDSKASSALQDEQNQGHQKL